MEVEAASHTPSTGLLKSLSQTARAVTLKGPMSLMLQKVKSG